MEELPNSLVMVGAPHIPRTWEVLLSHALTLVDEIAKYGRDEPFWTFGGGTVLMLRYGHRFSKDIDIFVPDPQSLGYVSPRLSEVAESIADSYVETATNVKLFFPEGEIDFVAAPNLTTPGFVAELIGDRRIRVETSVEIVAKKMWHRGDRITGRDIFDFAQVFVREPDAVMAAKRFMIRHCASLLAQLDVRRAALKKQFDAIDVLDFHQTFDDASSLVRHAMASMRST